MKKYILGTSAETDNLYVGKIRHLDRTDQWLNVDSWVWLLAFGAFGVGVFLYQEFLYQECPCQNCT